MNTSPFAGGLGAGGGFHVLSVVGVGHCYTLILAKILGS